MYRHFTKEDNQIDNKHMKRSTTAFVFWEMPVKITMWYYYKPTHQNGYNLTSDNNKYYQGCRTTRILIHCQWEYKLVQSLRKVVIIHKFENMHSLWPRNSNPRYIPNRNSSTHNQKTCIIIFIVLLFIITPNNKQSKYSLSVEWINCGIFKQGNNIQKYK